ncbi:hypothetical protein, partial [Escherichia coli]|uniref:hypothetical protein n=1 Tax=Escherichia coli TaxID=562 RepID=UPI0032F08FF8
MLYCIFILFFLWHDVRWCFAPKRNENVATGAKDKEKACFCHSSNLLLFYFLFFNCSFKY